MTQQRFPCMQGIKPPRPTMRTEQVALRIAERIVKEVNLDDYYWEPRELPDRIWDVQQEIIQAGYPAGVFWRLWKKQPLISCKGERGLHPYGWKEIDDHCRHIADGIADEETAKAVAEWRRRYG